MNYTQIGVIAFKSREPIFSCLFIGSDRQRMYLMLLFQAHAKDITVIDLIIHNIKCCPKASEPRRPIAKMIIDYLIPILYDQRF